MKFLVLTSLVVAAATTNNFYKLASPYSYSCEESACVRYERGQVSEYQPLAKCQVTCGKFGALWPQPTGDVQLAKDVAHFSPENLRVTKVTVPNQEVSTMLEGATRYFQRNLHFLHPDFPKSQKGPYTEEERAEVPVDQYNQRRFKQQPNPFRQETLQQTPQQAQQTQQQAQQTQQQFETNQDETQERWERYSPFQNEKHSSGIQRQRVNIEITVTTGEQRLRLNTDESYHLEVKTVGEETLVKIQAPTYFGARHALETLSQTIAFDEDSSALMIVKDVTVKDEPQFKYRGLMLDTSRNYYPKRDIMHLMDTMAQNKMNYFQWHIIDSASFPMYIQSRPEMAYYGSYSARKVYYPQDIQEIVEYGRMLGIQTVPELSAPGHTNAGWQWAEKSGKGKLVLCAGESESQEWWRFGKEPSAGQLNPVNPETYNVLSEIYKDTLNNFDPEMVHMGGDDVSFKCWQNSPEIAQYLAANNREANSQEMFELWNVFQSNAYAKLVENSSPEKKVTPIIHSSSFVRNYIDKNTYVVQINELASDSTIAQYVKDGYKVIFSNFDQWRADCIDTTWVGEKSAKCPAKTLTWKNFYENSPLDQLAENGIPNLRSDQSQQSSQSSQRDNILGGIVSLYSSETDANGMDSKYWPRTSAMAERLWADPAKALLGNDSTQKRLSLQRARMASRGVRADPIQPEFCMHDEKSCYSQEEHAARSANIPQ